MEVREEGVGEEEGKRERGKRRKTVKEERHECEG